MIQIMLLMVVGAFLFAIWLLIRHFDDREIFSGGNSVVGSILRTIFGLAVFMIVLAVVIVLVAAISNFFLG